MMQWLDDFIRRWRIAREARREARLTYLANSVPSFEWLLIKAGTAVQARSPMLAVKEIREWFREEYPSAQIVYIDNDRHVLFYE